MGCERYSNPISRFRRCLTAALVLGTLAAGFGKAEPAAKASPAPETVQPEEALPETGAPQTVQPEAVSAETAQSVPTPAPDPGAGPTPSAVEGNGRIELHVKDDALANVLELLSQQYRLNIVASKQATGRVTADLYDVTVEEALDAVCKAAGLGWVREANCIYIYTKEEIEAQAMDTARMVTEVFQLNYLSAAEAVVLLEPAKSEKGTIAVSSEPEEGIPSGSSGGTGGNSFCLPDTVVARDFPENLERMREILQQMDRRPRQVLVEATIVQVQLDDTTSLGVDFNALAGVDFRDLSNTATPITDPTTNANDAATTVAAAQAPYGHVAQMGFATQGTGLNIGVITNNVSFFIHALEEVTDTTILSNPKVLALNKQRAEVMVGERLGYITSTATETSTVETVDFLDTGTQLRFRPFISDDGYVRMEIHPEVSSGVVINGLPQETTTEVTCNVMVKDGHTIVIGGLFDEDVSIGRNQVPGLGDLPGLGWLFRSKEDSTTRNEIIILLTPHIIDNEEDAAALGESMLADAKRRCLGLREGFSFFTRERLTVDYVQKAEQAWARYQQSGAKADLDDAHWHMQLALNVAPNNLKALRLKDRILTARTGEPSAPTDLTIYDRLSERLRQIDKARGLALPRLPYFRVPSQDRPNADAPTGPATGEPQSGSRPTGDKARTDTAPAAKDREGDNDAS